MSTYGKNEFEPEDENFICDTSNTKIGKKISEKVEININCTSKLNSQLQCKSQIFNTKLNEKENENVTENRDLPRLYVNTVECDRKDAKKTIKDLVFATRKRNNEVVEVNQNKNTRISFDIILRLLLPLANGVLRGIKGIRDVRFLQFLKSIPSSRQTFTNLIAFAANTISMNLSSVQVSHHIEPILKLMKIRKLQDGVESLPDIASNIPSSIDGQTLTSPNPTITHISNISFMRDFSKSSPLSYFKTNGCFTSIEQQSAPKCCTLNILAEPPPGVPIRADVVLIHGLHGSLANTWKQGLWENDRQPVGFERPPKPPVRPPKRPRHSRTHLLHAPHKQKRARFAQSDERTYSTEKDVYDEYINSKDDDCSDFSYVRGQPTDIEICEGVEYSFPTFRLRIKDNGQLLQAEIESILKDKNAKCMNDLFNAKNKQSKENFKANPKRSASDPDYSKCWPGDWLPLDCPGVRVIAVNYTTDQYLWRPLWKKKESRTNLVQRAREMANLLIEQRVGHGHPIIWVGHSKGGLFVKQIIVDAWESGRSAMAPFWLSSRGAFFYSVPHRGSHLASIKAPLLTRSVELIDIEKNSKYLLDLHKRFVGLYHLGHLKIEVFSFVETALTLMSVLYLRIVGVDSADPGIGDVCGIRLDHREICKPRGRDCILYKELVKMINKVC